MSKASENQMCFFDGKLLWKIIIKFGKLWRWISHFTKGYSHPRLISTDSPTQNKNKQNTIPKNQGWPNFYHGSLGRKIIAMLCRRMSRYNEALRIFVCLVACILNLLLWEHRMQNWKTQVLCKYTWFIKWKDDPSLTRLLDGRIKPDSKSEKIKYYLD